MLSGGTADFDRHNGGIYCSARVPRVQPSTAALGHPPVGLSLMGGTRYISKSPTPSTSSQYLASSQPQHENMDHKSWLCASTLKRQNRTACVKARKDVSSHGQRTTATSKKIVRNANSQPTSTKIPYGKNTATFGTLGISIFFDACKHPRV